MTYEGKPILLNEKLLASWLSESKPWVTYVLIAVNVIGFLAMCAFTNGAAFFTPTSAQLLDWGANWAPLTLSGQEWRLVTHGFLHIGVIHLVMNMYVLWLFGRICERLLGSTKYLIIYFLSDIGAALFSSLYCLRISEIISAGSSGPICGILGAYFVIIWSHRSDFEPGRYKSMMRKFAEYALTIVVYGMFVHADHRPHLGGVLTGALLGAALLPKVKGEKLTRRQLYTLAIICLSFCGVCFLESTGAVDSDGLVSLQRVQILRAQNRNDEATIALKDFLQHHPQSVAAYVQLANCEIESGDNESAKDTINTALRLDPKNDAVKSLSACFAFNEGDYDTCLRKCAKVPADSPYSKINRGYFVARIHGVQGHLDLALLEAAALPAATDRTKMLIYSQAGMDSQANKLADTILRKDANNREAIYVRMVTSWRNMDYKEVMRQSKIFGECTPPNSLMNSYAAFIYSIAASMIGDNHPGLLLEKYQADVQKNEWARAIGDYLQNRISESQLISRARDRAQKTEAYAYVGLNLLAHKHPEQAKEYLLWVVQNGVPTFVEYSLADSELRRLNSTDKSGPPK